MTAVTLQIYDLVEQTPFCCGFFHTGVLVRGVEWSFGGGGGIVGTPPRASVPDDCRFREALLLGYIENNADIGRCLDRVRPDFQADTYNVVFKNCNDFSHRFCQELFRDQGGRGIPAYINRLAWWGRQWPAPRRWRQYRCCSGGGGARLKTKRSQPWEQGGAGARSDPAQRENCNYAQHKNGTKKEIASQKTPLR
eukprot:g9804.t1